MDQRIGRRKHDCRADGAGLSTTLAERRRRRATRLLCLSADRKLLSRAVLGARQRLQWKREARGRRTPAFEAVRPGDGGPQELKSAAGPHAGEVEVITVA
jgi:hypothetical protein